jgi:glutamyl/glutaminyl-tRNA synthetase
MRTGYRGRLAPSPTGYLHLGHASTFWTAYQRSLAASGTLLLRNEDLDPQRSRAEFAAAMSEDLRWLGILWQEGPDVGGPCAPYAQSQRRSLYLAAWMRLVADGFAYPCTCSRRDLARVAEAPHEAAHNPPDEPLYPGTCRPPAGRAVETIDRPLGLNWRFRVPDGEALEYEDRRQGRQRFVAGRDDVPSYQLAVVVDDALMGVTEVVRGADLLISTARQMLLQRALGWTTPDYYHCDLLTDERGERLAKRHDALSLRALRAAGCSPADVLALIAERQHSAGGMAKNRVAT